MERIAVFAALRWECVPVLRHIRQARRHRLGEFTAWRGPAGGFDMWLVQTGMGQERAAAAVAALREMGPFNLFLSTGCAGALAPELGPGDLAVATTVIGTPSGERFETDATTRARVRTAAERVAVRTTVGPLLCSGTVLGTAVAKQTAAAETGAVAVEMEGAAIGAGAQQMGVPFAAVRAILDTASTELDTSAGFVDPQTGGVRPLPLLRYVARRPSRLPYLMGLQRMTVAAQRSLEQFFKAFLNHAD